MGCDCLPKRDSITHTYALFLCPKIITIMKNLDWCWAINEKRIVTLWNPFDWQLAFCEHALAFSIKQSHSLCNMPIHDIGLRRGEYVVHIAFEKSFVRVITKWIVITYLHLPKSCKLFEWGNNDSLTHFAQTQNTFYLFQVYFNFGTNLSDN